VIALHLKDGDGSLDTKRQVPLGTGGCRSARSSRRRRRASASSSWTTRPATCSTPFASARDLLVELAGA
jgi:hypothetical protein